MSEKARCEAVSRTPPPTPKGTRVTQEQTAEQCGIGYKLYQLYELGIKQNPGLTSLEKLAAGFGLEICELLTPTLPQNRRKLQKM